MAIKIGIDARSLGAKVCGVSRVTLRLIEALSAVDKENPYCVFTDSTALAGVLNSNFSVCNTCCPRMNPAYDFKFMRIILGMNLDVFHSVHSWFPFGVRRLKARKFVTIHDMFAVTDPNFFLKYGALSGVARQYFSYLTERSAREADTILTVSEYSKQRIQEVIPAALGKIKVVYNASGLGTNGESISNTPAVNPKCLLYVGNCRSYKNVPVLIRGFLEYVSANTESGLSLVIAGNDASPEIKNLVKECGLSSRVIFYTNPDDSALRKLYSEALALIMPSREEGFGIPVLEAMGLGLPVIISDADALVEVVGDAALVFPKDDYRKLGALIQRVTKDINLCEDLRRRGVARSSVFSWQKSALELKSLYLKSIRSEVA